MPCRGWDYFAFGLWCRCRWFWLGSWGRGGRRCLGSRYRFQAIAVASDKFREIRAPGVVNQLGIVAEALEQSFDVGGVCAKFFGNDLG